MGSIRPALAKDVQELQTIANDAYSLYVPRIGRKPAPMVADFSVHVLRREVFALDDQEQIAAYIVTFPLEADQFVENVAVRPNCQGCGYGFSLMTFAETRACENGLNKLVLIPT